MTSATTTKPTPQATKTKNATELLCADHKLVSSLFAEYEKARSKDKKKELVAQICQALSVHAQVEGMEPDGEMFDAKIKVLSEYVEHHVKEEQNEMCPKANATKLDMAELGAEITARKEELLAEKTSEVA